MSGLFVSHWRNLSATSDKAAEAVKPKGIGADEKLEKIPIDIIGNNEEKILEYLPEVKSGETEDAYLERCVIVLYPEYMDEQGGYSLCADKYQRIITKSDTGTTEFNINKIAEKIGRAHV